MSFRKVVLRVIGLIVIFFLPYLTESMHQAFQIPLWGFVPIAMLGGTLYMVPVLLAKGQLYILYNVFEKLIVKVWCGSMFLFAGMTILFSTNIFQRDIGQLELLEITICFIASFMFLNGTRVNLFNISPIWIFKEARKSFESGEDRGDYGIKVRIITSDEVLALDGNYFITINCASEGEEYSLTFFWRKKDKYNVLFVPSGKMPYKIKKEALNMSDKITEYFLPKIMAKNLS